MSFARFVSTVNAERQRNAVPIHEQAHLHNGVGSVFFAGSILPDPAFLLDLKIIVGTVIVQDAVIPLSHVLAELVQLCLNTDLFLAYDVQCAVDVVEFIVWLFMKCFRILISGQLGRRVQDTSIYQMPHDLRKVV